MKKKKKEMSEPSLLDQPEPFTQWATRGMVRQHAYELFRDKLPQHPLTLEDWVLAERDLVDSMDLEMMSGR